MKIKIRDRLLNMNLMEKEPHDPEIVRTVARMKRLVEKWNLDADFRKACESDLEKRSPR